MLKPRQFSLIVDDGTKRIQDTALRKKLLRTIDGPDNTPAETGIAVYLDSHQPRMPNLP